MIMFASSEPFTSSVDYCFSSVELLCVSDLSCWLDSFDVSSKGIEPVITVSPITLEFLFPAILFSIWFSCNPSIVYGLGLSNATDFVLGNSSSGDWLLDD